jgi:uncharacterized protein (DUF2062 family)
LIRTAAIFTAALAYILFLAFAEWWAPLVGAQALVSLILAIAVGLALIGLWRFCHVLGGGE